ncbi:BRO-N domain-containing protein [Salinibacter sp.]|uniref:BRO-N domain-containing protein n=1 Tax=Salinibacter sp. TaxID=2065818 RepID=UPI003D74B3FD
MGKHGSATLLYTNPPQPRPQDKRFQIVTPDVADVLNYSRAADFTRLVSNDYKGREKLSTPGRPQEMVIVSELGLYEGLASSSQDMAKPFQDWLWNHLREYRKGERPD